MCNEIINSNNSSFNGKITISLSIECPSFYAQITDAISSIAENRKTLETLKQIQGSSKSIDAEIEKQTLKVREQNGYLLGVILANISTLPTEIASKQKINGVPMSTMIKAVVDREVREAREKCSYANDMTFAKEYWKRYRRLSEMISGYGYNLYFITERFEEFYPNGIHVFVRGFAEGYSSAFRTIATESHVNITETNPLEQDIWKNWPYFLDATASEYTLMGKYLFPYHGGCGPKDMPYGNNVHEINTEAYDALRARPVDDFFEEDFCLVF